MNMKTCHGTEGDSYRVIVRGIVWYLTPSVLRHMFTLIIVYD
ncbi:hypothetical protein E2C01_013670 [Portunus trituberculatus]|uniref:Uncharacterized protein n=1 Tax=Portunus trituberculatus TaxID=210409 RepID=A0A5B7DHX2_PORTR|nr:hypothetical protein [Portunus trituberculatus]